MADEDVLSQLIGTGIQEAVNEAIRLGMQWQMRLGTVQVQGNRPMVLLDGDAVAIPTLPLTGAVGTGNRVMVISVPPSLNAIVGGVVGHPRTNNNLHIVRLASNTALALAQTSMGIISENVNEGAFWMATGLVSANTTVVAAGVDALGLLELDGVQQTGRARGSIATLGVTTGYQQWAGTVPSGGLHTWEFFGAKSGAGGTVTALGTDTTLMVAIYGA